MNDQQLLRYGRHILLNEIGIEGQQRLLDASVLIIGLGGLDGRMERIEKRLDLASV
jgi:molybdopterin-synthase adenylyltransferase